MAHQLMMMITNSKVGAISSASDDANEEPEAIGEVEESEEGRRRTRTRMTTPMRPLRRRKGGGGR